MFSEFSRREAEEPTHAYQVSRSSERRSLRPAVLSEFTTDPLEDSAPTSTRASDRDREGHRSRDTRGESHAVIRSTRPPSVGPAKFSLPDDFNDSGTIRRHVGTSLGAQR